MSIEQVGDVRQWRTLLCSAQAARDLVPSARLVLLVLADCMNPDGSRCYPALRPPTDRPPEGRSLIERTGLSARRVMEHLAEAERLGYVIQTAPGYRRQNATYVPASPKGCEPSHPSTAAAEAKGCEPSHERVRALARKGASGRTPPRSTPTATSKDNPPNPPASRGACATHVNRPGVNCRSCGTSVRQVNGVRRRETHHEERERIIADALARAHAAERSSLPAVGAVAVEVADADADALAAGVDRW